MKIYKKYLLGLLLCLSIIMIVGCSKQQVKESKKENQKVETSKEEVFKSQFTKSSIPDEVYKNMIGKSIPKKDLVDINSLSYLKITYYGFDNKAHIGEMIVNKEVASEVLDIFKELYENKYPIEKMNLIDKYNADDDQSMKDDNTSAFCYRVIEGSDVISNHSKGLAIDINPLINPMVKNGVVSPNEGNKYIDREKNVKGMIRKGDACYEAFIKRGWTWGGDWKSLKDYQHFEK